MRGDGVIYGMWDRQSLQRALLGPPAGSDARQIVFSADHIDRRQLELCAAEPKRRERRERLAAIAHLAFLASRRRPEA